MSKYSNLRNRPFLIVRTIHRPNSDINTFQRGWAEFPRNWTGFERIEIKDRVSNRDMTEASTIVDLMRSEVIKQRTDLPEDQVVHHYLETYRKECTRAIEIWLNKVAQRMAADPNFAAAPKPPETPPETAAEAVSAADPTQPAPADDAAPAASQEASHGG